MAKWLVNLFITTFFTMVMIYLIKQASKKVPLPVVSKIVEEV